MHQFLKIILGMKLYMFRTVPLSIIRSFSLYTQQWYLSYRFADSLQAGSGCSSKPVWHKPLLCVQWKTPDDGQRNCPKHVEFHSKNKFEKLVHLVGFIIRNIPEDLIFTWKRSRLCICKFHYLGMLRNTIAWTLWSFSLDVISLPSHSNVTNSARSFHFRLNRSFPPACP